MNRETLLRILDLARWAPSGDNTQPWRFEIVADDQVLVHGFDTRDHVLYDFDGHPSHMAHGALLETIRIAASQFMLAVKWQRAADNADSRKTTYQVSFSESPAMVVDPLFPYIEKRTVQRRPMRLTPLTEEQRATLESAVDDKFSVSFFSELSERWQVGKLLWSNAYIRLTCPEAFQVHREIIEWGARYSETKIPEQAVGVDPVTARLMRWVLDSWPRVVFFNRYLFGTIAPRLQLDLLPALFCASHVLVAPKTSPTCLEDWLDLGISMQRLWLTATQQGLHLQPQMTPVIFRWYSRSKRSFSANSHLGEMATKLSQRFELIASASPVDPFGFFCRVGTCSSPRSRSLRLDLTKLLDS